MLELIRAPSPLCALLHFADDLLFMLKEGQDDYASVSLLMLSTQNNLWRGGFFEGWGGQAIHLSSRKCLNLIEKKSNNVFFSLSSYLWTQWHSRCSKSKIKQKRSGAHSEQMIMGLKIRGQCKIFNNCLLESKDILDFFFFFLEISSLNCVSVSRQILI